MPGLNPSSAAFGVIFEALILSAPCCWAGCAEVGNAGRTIAGRSCTQPVRGARHVGRQRAARRPP